MSAGWFSAATDEPRDQQRDLTVPGYWALVGPSHPDGWDWSAIDGSDGESIAFGHVGSETAAKQAVAEWEAANS